MRIIRYSAIMLLLLALSAGAVPRYSVMYNQSCTLCHVDPSGGGQRSLYGAQFFAYTDLAMTPTPLEKLGAIQPMLNDQIQIGFDMRTVFYGLDQPAGNTFMQMQGDLYLNFQLNPQWNFYLDKGLYSGFEIFGVGHILPYNGYIKAGRFTPPYGLRLADHKAFVRQRLLGFGEAWEETGVEIGFHPQQFTLALAATNGSESFQDGDEGKAVTARADVRFSLSEVRLWIGASGRYNEITSAGDVQVNVVTGGFGGIVYGPLQITGEVDYRNDDTVKRLATFAEAALHLRRGVLFKLEHDFWDANIDETSGAENMYLGGFEIVPTGFLQLIPNVRFHDLEPGSDADYYEGEIQFHLFF